MIETDEKVHIPMSETKPKPKKPRGVASLIEGRCIACGARCQSSCPVDCIEISRDRCRIDYKKCVRCLCCHEVCPYKAIYIKRNILTRMIWG